MKRKNKNLPETIIEWKGDDIKLEEKPVWLCLAEFLQAIFKERFYLVERLMKAYHQTKLASLHQNSSAEQGLTRMRVVIKSSF